MGGPWSEAKLARIRRKRPTMMRDRKILKAYRKGAAQIDIARELGCSPATVKRVLTRHDAHDPERAIAATIARNKARWTCPKWAEQQRNRIAEHKPALVWPDCPEHLRDDYETLSLHMTRRAARRMLEGAQQ